MCGLRTIWPHVVCEVACCTVVKTFIHQDARFEFDTLTDSAPLKLTLYRGCNVVKLFFNRMVRQAAALMTDRLKTNDSALWQARKR